MVLKKSKNINSTLFIDASQECVKVTNNNKLESHNIIDIIKWYTERIDVLYRTKLVPNSVIQEKDYSLTVSDYVEKENKKEKIDINVLNAEISKIVAREDVLRTEIDKIIREIEGV